MAKDPYLKLELLQQDSSRYFSAMIRPDKSSPCVVHLSVTPLERGADANPGYIKKKYFKQSFRFPRVKTGVLSGHLLLAGGYSFQVHIFVQAERSESLHSIKRSLMENVFHFPGTDVTIQFQDYGFVYLPQTQAFSLRMDPQKPSNHWTSSCFMGWKKPVMLESRELQEPIMGGEDPIESEDLYERLVAMVNGYIDNSVPDKNENENDDYKNVRIKDYHRMFEDKDNQAEHPVYVELIENYEDYIITSAFFFGGIKPYAPSCSDSVHWVPAALFDTRDFVYSLLGSYYLLEWSSFTLLCTVPIVFISALKRWLSVHAKLIEKNVNKPFISRKNQSLALGKTYARLWRSRQGMSCAMLCLIKNCNPADLYVTTMHYVAYSKRKYFFNLPEDMLIWIAYFNGLRLIMGGQATLLIGVGLGIVSFLLRHFLQSSPVDSPVCEQLSQFFVSLLYAVCYGTKDLIALHYTLSFAPDYLDALNGTLSNQTRLALLNGSDPWSQWTYNQTLDLPVIDGWSEEQRISFLAGLIFFDLTYYTFMNARSSKRDNPPGSKQLGFTGLVDCLGVASLLFFIPWDVFFMGMQSAEMLFALQVFTQMLYKLAIVSSSFELMLTLSVVPIVAMIIGFVFAAINVVYGCQLCCKTAEPWMQRADKALNSRPKAKQSLIEINYDMFRVGGDHDAQSFLFFLNDTKKPELEVKLFLQTMAIKAENWKTFKKIVSRYLPFLRLADDKEWLVLYQKALKIHLKIEQAQGPLYSTERRLAWFLKTGNRPQSETASAALAPHAVRS
jgi:hypothetical protein